MGLFSSFHASGHSSKSSLPSHTHGTSRGERVVVKHGREPGRQLKHVYRTARDSTSIDPQARDPIDPRMPHIPPA
jgi:hypothetical protein